MKRVLVIEDDINNHRAWFRKLRNKVVMIPAMSVEEAEELFRLNPDVAAIVVDACVPGNKPTTTPLVREIRRTFTGPMIAASSVTEYNQLLVEAGCNHASTKEGIPNKLMEILGM